MKSAKIGLELHLKSKMASKMASKIWFVIPQLVDHLETWFLCLVWCFWGRFSIAPGPIHKIQLRDFDLTEPRDTVTSWRHSMTHPNLFSLSQLVEVLERWFFFCFYETLGCWVRKCCQCCICMMTSRHDVMSWRQKRRYSISVCRSAREMILFLFL